MYTQKYYFISILRRADNYFFVFSHKDTWICFKAVFECFTFLKWYCFYPSQGYNFYLLIISLYMNQYSMTSLLCQKHWLVGGIWKDFFDRFRLRCWWNCRGVCYTRLLLQQNYLQHINRPLVLSRKSFQWHPMYVYTLVAKINCLGILRTRFYEYQ